MLVDDLIIRHSIEIGTAIITVIFVGGKTVQAFKDHKTAVARQISDQKAEMTRIADKIDKSQQETYKQLQALMQATIKNDTEIKNLLNALIKIEKQLYNIVSRKD